MDVSVFQAIAPYQEYLLQGSILEAHRDVLLHRLNGLCDTVDTGPEKFHDHEMAYLMRHLSPAAHQSITFRVRHALDHPDAPWHLRYVGTPDADKSKKTVVRNCIDVGTSENVEAFLKDMGFVLEYEYIVRGYLFRKGRMRITVSKIFKVMIRGNVDNVAPISQSYLVELSVAAPPGQDQVQEDIRNFAEQLKPLVQLEKITDTTFLSNLIVNV